MTKKTNATVIACDNCGREEFLTFENERDLWIEKKFEDELAEEGWAFRDKENKHYCPKCDEE